jgi:hypothetical protein
MRNRGYFSAGHVPAEICGGNAVQVIVQLRTAVFAVLMVCGRYEMLF